MKNHKRPLLRRLPAWLVGILVLLALSVTAFATETIRRNSGTYEYTTKGYTWEKVSEATDETTGVTTRTWGMDTDNDGKHNITLVQNGNEWTYHFSVYDENAKYYVTEVLNNGKDKTYTLKDADGNPIPYATIEEGAGEVVIYNAAENYGLPDYGSLKLTKKLTDSEGNEVTDQETLFVFDVTLTYEKPEGGDAVDITPLLTGSQNYGDVNFTWSVSEEKVYTAAARITLKAGESTNMTDIPAGVSYAVTELTEGYDTVWSGNPTGIIEKETEISVTCTNKEPDTPPDPETEKGRILVKKTVRTTEGTEVPEDTTEFSYRAVFGGLTAGSTYVCTVYDKDGAPVPDKTDTTFTPLADGSAVVDFALTNGQYILFDSLPVGAAYQVMEYAAEGYTPSYELTNFTSVASSAGENYEAGTDLTTGRETLDKDEAEKSEAESVLIHFTNTVPAPKGDTIEVTVKKEWKEEEDSAGTDHTGQAVTIYLMQAITPEDMENNYGDVAGTVTLDGTEDTPWTYTFTDLELYQENGDLYYYYVQEQEVDGYYPEIVPAYQMTTDENGKEVIDYTKSYSFTITNVAGVKLPAAGGPGTLLYVCTGLLMMAGSVVFKYKQHKKRKGGKSI